MAAQSLKLALIILSLPVANRRNIVGLCGTREPWRVSFPWPWTGAGWLLGGQIFRDRQVIVLVAVAIVEMLVLLPLARWVGSQDQPERYLKT
jgi:hypothetical protein